LHIRCARGGPESGSPGDRSSLPRRTRACGASPSWKIERASVGRQKGLSGSFSQVILVPAEFAHGGLPSEAPFPSVPFRGRSPSMGLVCALLRHYNSYIVVLVLR